MSIGWRPSVQDFGNLESSEVGCLKVLSKYACHFDFGVPRPALRRLKLVKKNFISEPILMKLSR